MSSKIDYCDTVFYPLPGFLLNYNLLQLVMSLNVVRDTNDFLRTFGLYMLMLSYLASRSMRLSVSSKHG